MIGRKQQMHMKIYSDHIKFIIIPVIEASEKEVKSLVFII